MHEKLTVNNLVEGLALLIEAVRESTRGQRQRVLIMDSQLRVLNEFADRLEDLEARLENVLLDYKAHCRICARLNILCTDVGMKEQGPPDDEKDLEEKLSDWH